MIFFACDCSSLNRVSSTLRWVYISLRLYHEVRINMNQEKVKIRLSDESAASLGCLLGRAQLSKEYSSLFYDAKAVELAEKIDYDFSTSNMPFRGIMFNLFLKGNLPQFNLFMLRAKQFDDKLKVYITEHPRASVVNIGAGLDMTFYRVDNGIIHWYTSTYLRSSISESNCSLNLTG